MSEKSRCPSCLGNKKVLGIGNFHKRDCSLCSGTGFIEKPTANIEATSGLAQQEAKHTTAVHIDPYIKNHPVNVKETDSTVSNDGFITTPEQAKEYYHPKEGNKHGKGSKGSSGKK